MADIPEKLRFVIITVCVNRWEFLHRSLPTWHKIPDVARIVVATYAFDTVPDWLAGVTLLTIDSPQFHRTRASNAAAVYALQTDKPTHLLFLDSDVRVIHPLVFHEPLLSTPLCDYTVDSNYAIPQLKRELVDANDPEYADRGKRGTHAVRSAVFAEINGFDQRLQGWGFEDLNLYSRYWAVSQNYAVYDRTMLDHQPHDNQIRASLNPGGATFESQLQVNMKIHNEQHDVWGKSWCREMGYPKVHVSHLAPRALGVVREPLPNKKREQEAQLDRSSARVILEHLFSYIQSQSVLDVGCGIGTWLSVLQELGVSDLVGIVGKRLDLSKVIVDPRFVQKHDLQRGFSLARRFDLTLCLRVAEHCRPETAATLVASLTTHSDAVLFSAAIPFQQEQLPVNAQFPSYWAALFADHGFRVCDVIRPHIWLDPQVHPWLRQNTLLFVHERCLEVYPRLCEQTRVSRPLDVVHPEVYLARIQPPSQTAKRSHTRS